MARYLTGVQSSGIPHMGNILGAILPSIRFSQQADNECLYFIADYHSLTTIKSAEERKKNVHATAAAWLAFGFDFEKNILFRQSDVKEVLELTWILSCFTPYPMLANAHSFKDKADRLSDVNAGLFTYPVLMAADILLYDTEFVPVGKDQLQHIEIARDIASAFNHHYQSEALFLPQAVLQKGGLTIPGTDGAKMSKSYGNFIDVFADEKSLRKTIMAIKTDSTPLEEPKNPANDTVFTLYSLLASEDESAVLAGLYKGGNFGYGHAKQMLLEKTLDYFGAARMRFNELMQAPDEIEEILAGGASRAKEKAGRVMERVKILTGFK